VKIPGSRNLFWPLTSRSGVIAEQSDDIRNHQRDSGLPGHQSMCTPSTNFDTLLHSKTSVHLDAADAAERRTSPPPPSKFTRSFTRKDPLLPTQLQQDCIRLMRRSIGEYIIASELYNMELTRSQEDLWAAADSTFLQIN
jgi:hypothetical protein